MVRRRHGARAGACRSPKAGDSGCARRTSTPPTRCPRTRSGRQQTIALVDAYNDPTAEADLKTYDEEFGLPACTTANGCFKTGQPERLEAALPFPKTLGGTRSSHEAGTERRTKQEAEEAIGWGVEISLDIETAHATCQSCKILLVEATAPPATRPRRGRAPRRGARAPREISNSWGAAEEVVGRQRHASAFNHPGIVITASAGDDGYLNWDAEARRTRTSRSTPPPPRTSSRSAARGCTRWAIGGGWQGETVWNGSGASRRRLQRASSTRRRGSSEAADWALGRLRRQRAVADVSADADPYTGVVIATPTPRRRCETATRSENRRIHTLAELVHLRRHQPRLADRRLGVRARGRRATASPTPPRRCTKTLRNAPAAARRDAGSNGECGTGLRRQKPASRLHGRRRGGGQLLLGARLPGRPRLRRADRRRHPRRASSPSCPAGTKREAGSRARVRSGRLDGARPAAPPPPAAPARPPTTVDVPDARSGLTAARVIALEPTARRTAQDRLRLHARTCLTRVRVAPRAAGALTRPHALGGRRPRRDASPPPRAATSGAWRAPARLPPGLYRLTLTPAAARRARSLPDRLSCAQPPCAPYSIFLALRADLREVARGSFALPTCI